MVTGYADGASFDQMTLADQQTFGLVGRVLRVTNFCHIFPPSTNWNLKPVEFRHPKVYATCCFLALHTNRNVRLLTAEMCGALLVSSEESTSSPNWMVSMLIDYQMG